MASGAVATLTEISLDNGVAVLSDRVLGGPTAMAASIDNAGDLTLDNVTISGSLATGIGVLGAVSASTVLNRVGGSLQATDVLIDGATILATGGIAAALGGAGAAATGFVYNEGFARLNRLGLNDVSVTGGNSGAGLAGDGGVGGDVRAFLLKNGGDAAVTGAAFLGLTGEVLTAGAEGLGNGVFPFSGVYGVAGQVCTGLSQVGGVAIDFNGVIGATGDDRAKANTRDGVILGFAGGDALTGGLALTFRLAARATIPSSSAIALTR